MPMNRYLLMFGLVLVTSCVSQPPRSAAKPPLPTAKTEAQCLALHGTWSLHGETEMDTPFCAVPTTDGGKRCNDYNDCEGHCLAPHNAKLGAKGLGRCTPTSHSGACFTRVENGRAMWPVCS